MKEITKYNQVNDWSQGDFDVFVIDIEKTDNPFPVYGIINRITGVLEYASENSFYIKDWLETFIPKPKAEKAEVVSINKAN